MPINKRIDQNNYDQRLYPLSLKKQVVCKILVSRKSNQKNIIS